MIKEQVYKRYKGKGEHNINELELVIEQREEELHLMRSGEQTLGLPDISKQIIRKGFVQAMNGNNLLINTLTDELVEIVVKDKKTRWNMYCKHVKITIEEIDKSEFD